MGVKVIRLEETTEVLTAEQLWRLLDLPEYLRPDALEQQLAAAESLRQRFQSYGRDDGPKGEQP